MPALKDNATTVTVMSGFKILSSQDAAHGS
jgi:hypothetical protein